MDDRHTRVETICEECGNVFIARKERVENGLSRFCSREHWLLWKSKNKYSNKEGKENAITYHKQSGGYFVQWTENGKPKNKQWHNWAWEMNFGEIPDGHKVEYTDGDKEHIEPSNLQLRRTRVGRKLLPKKKKVFSLEHRNKISQSMIERWKAGVFDIHRGSNNKNWKPDITKHPKEFNTNLKNFIRERDGHICQICGDDLVGKRQPVHHIDGVKSHNEHDNLILLCSPCHCKVHLTSGASSPVILAFRSKLLE